MSPVESSAVVRAEEMAFRYPSGRRGIEPTTLAARPGEIVALVGPNGSGKSTFLRLLATDLQPTGGRLSLLGTDARRPRPSLRRRIAWAADEPVHLEALSGAENLRLFLQLSRRGGFRARYAEELLDAFNLSADRNVPVSEYSFGMGRKLLLTEVLAAEPELLLLDEPTVGLDPPGIAALRKEVRRAAARGASVFIATNEIVETPLMADRIVFLHEGRPLADGAPAKLLNEVRGRTRITIDVTGELETLPAMPDIESLHVQPGRVVAESSRGTRALPRLLEALIETGTSIREIQVREPNLSDVFRRLSGVELDTDRAERGAE